MNMEVHQCTSMMVASSKWSSSRFYVFFITPPILILLFLTTNLLADRGSDSDSHWMCPKYDEYKVLLPKSVHTDTPRNCTCEELNHGEDAPAWEIFCYRRDDSGITMDPTGFEEVPAVSTLFNVKYVYSNSLEIHCIEASPNFLPAMFQGFQMEDIDLYTIRNCSLPTIPYHLIFHRAVVYRDKDSPQSAVGNSRKSPRGPLVSKEISIRKLQLKGDIARPIRLSLENLQKLFVGLKELERLRIENHQFEISPELSSVPRNKRKRSFTSEPKQGHSRSRLYRQVRASESHTSLPSSNSTILSSSSSTTSFSSSSPSTTVKNSATLKQSETTNKISSNAPVISTPTSLSLGDTVALTDNAYYFNHYSQPEMSHLAMNNISSPATSSPKTTLSSSSSSTNKFMSREDKEAPLFTPKIDDVSKQILNKKATNDLNSPRTSSPSMTTPIPVTISTVDSHSADGALDSLDNDGNEMSETKSEVPNALANDRDDSSVPSIQLNFSFGSYFRNLKHLTLTKFMVTKSPNNPGIMKLLLAKLDSIESLDISLNHLDHLPSNFVSDSGHHLTKLYLMSNSIESLDPNCFSNLNQLEVLDITNNRLKYLPEGVFRHLTNLKQFRMRANQFITLPQNLFAFNSKLELLDLSANHNLSGANLPVDLLRGLQRLTKLDLSESKLDQLSQNPVRFLSHASDLEILNLGNNRLTNLTRPRLFGLNPKLKTLNISGNRISSIDATIFTDNSSNLAELNLSVNQLTSLPDKLLYPLKNLRVLNLAHNKLHRITNNNLFYTNSRLEELDFSHNNLVSINPDGVKIPFGQAGDLRKINLSHNNISDYMTEFASINWATHVQIEDIDLSHNRISKTVSIPQFTSNAPRISLNLRNNLIENIDVYDILNTEEAIKNSYEVDRDIKSSAVKVSISGNPFNCDCNLYPLLKYIKSEPNVKFQGIIEKVKFDPISDIACAKPPTLRNVDFINISKNDLTCPLHGSHLCPNQCECRYEPSDDRVTIDCQGRNLTKIPRQLMKFENFQSIIAGGKTVNTIRAATVDLRYNLIQDLQPFEILLSHSSQRPPIPETRIKGGRSKQKHHKEPGYSQKNPILFDLKLDYNRIFSISSSFVKILKSSFTALNENFNPPSVSDRGSGESFSSPSSLGTSSSHKFAIINLLSLSHNNIHSVPAQLLGVHELQASDFPASHSKPHLVRLYLGHNPYNCTPESIIGADEKPSCQMREFKLWLTSNHRIVADIKNITCENLDYNSTSPLIKLPDSVLCPQLLIEDQTVLLTLSGICVVLAIILLILSISYYRNKQTVLAFLYIHLNPIFVCFFHENDMDQDKTYDAFVSYSSSDRDIVTQLIEKLEKPSSDSDISINYLKSQSGLPSVHEGLYDQIVPEVSLKMNSNHNQRVTNDTYIQNGGGQGLNIDADSTENNGQYFKLCIHERDWIPGNLISWNISNSVQTSRRTIIILSKEFIQSIWFKVEFHTAYYQMLMDKIDRLIIIVRGELPPKEDLDKDLASLLTTKTYLVWGEKWFWDKLRYALPHKKNHEARKPLRAQINKTLLSTNALNLLKSSKKSGHKSASKIMKEYVDQTIADHFQLNCASNGSIAMSNDKAAINSQTNTVFSSSQVQPSSGKRAMEAGMRSGNVPVDPSVVGVSSDAERLKDSKSKNSSKHGHVNESFVIETET
ncbi:uncharacterized protein LOC141851707 [Brevipalpus obovatus]|uniref:uncharacterized protein LOC141851707 n=1 Tax=Brevipalpus obovatus TaxID=246614 RepID=UPI003D9F6B7B